MALEIMVPNGAIRNLIREDKVHQIYSMMQTGQDKYGMQTFNQALATLYHKRQITLDVALQRSSNVDELRELIDRGAGLNTGNQGNKQHAVPMPKPARSAAAHQYKDRTNLWSSLCLPMYLKAATD